MSASNGAHPRSVDQLPGPVGKLRAAGLKINSVLWHLVETLAAHEGSIIALSGLKLA